MLPRSSPRNGAARACAGLLGLLAASAFAGSLHAAQSRFLSYGSEAECLAGRLLDPALCRSAFANARMAFEAKTPAFASLAQCVKTYGACAAWPPGTSSTSSFRPRWDGVDIVETPREKTVTPLAAPGVTRLSFAPMPLSEFHSLDVRGSRSAPSGRAWGLGRPALPRHGRGSEAASVAVPPPPGSGFKVEDGVLTFPAPARFQPKNLPKTP